MASKPIQPLVLDSIGIYGLNRQSSASSLPPQFLTTANNIMLDEKGRVTTREGIKQITNNVHTGSLDTDGNFGTPEPLGSHINTEGRENFPFIIDEKLFFSSDGHLGLGGLDVFVTDLSKQIEIQTVINQYKKYSNPNQLLTGNKIGIVIEEKPSKKNNSIAKSSVPITKSTTIEIAKNEEGKIESKKINKNRENKKLNILQGHWNKTYPTETNFITKHILPNSLISVVTFLPFRISGAILILTSLDFLGLGVPPTTPSLGELLAQGKDNISAWWLSLTTFFVLVGTLLLLIFIGSRW